MISPILYLLLLTLSLEALGCAVPLQISATNLGFQGSTSSPVTADIILDQDDARNLDIIGQLFVLHEGDCSIQDILSVGGGLEVNISTNGGSIQVVPESLQSTVQPTGVLGFLAGLFIDAIKVDVSNISFSVQSDLFMTSEDGRFDTDIVIEVLGGLGVADIPIIPGGPQTVDLKGETVTVPAMGQISQDENNLLSLTIPDFQVTFDVGISGVDASVMLSGNLAAQEVL